MQVNQGFFLQLVNRSNSRIVFSVATDEMNAQAFEQLWSTVGRSIFSGLKTDPRAANYYELRVDPILGEHPAQQR